MKKSILVAMAAAFSMAAMTGCSGGSETAATTAAATTAAAETTAADTTAAETTVTESTSAETEAASGEAAGEDGPTVAKIKAAGKIVMGTSPDFAPWEFKDVSSGTTEYVGSDVALGKYIAEKLGVELEIKPMEFSAIIQAVNTGNVDIGISGFAYTEERAQAVGLSTSYNMSSRAGQGLLVLKEKASEYNTAESFAGKKIATQNASLQNKLTTEQLPSDITIQNVTTVTDGVMMLTTGKVDAVAVSGDNGESLIKTYPELAMADFKFDYTSDGNVVAICKDNQDLLEAVNAIIEEVNETGLYEEWKEEAIALADSLGIETN